MVHWALPYALMARSLGYLTDETIIFAEKIDKPITRLEMADILGTICVVNKVSGIRNEEASFEFSDIGDLEEDSINNIKIIADKGFVKGYPDGTFGPDKTMTRAECATIIYRFNYSK